VPTVVAASVLIVGFIATLGIQNQRIARQRDTAEAASARATATEAFLVDMIRSPDPTMRSDGAAAGELTVVDALHRGRARVDAELADQPEIQAALLGAMGRSFSGLGRHELADTLLQRSLQLHLDLYGARDERSRVVMNEIGSNYADARRFAAADSMFSEVLRQRTEAGALSDTNLVYLLGKLSSTRLELEDADSARALVGRAISIRQQARDTLDSPYVALLGHLARSFRALRHFDSAEVVYRQILEREQNEPNPDRYRLSITHNNLAFLQRTRGNFAAAESSYRHAVEMTNQVLGDGHPMAVMVGSNLANTLEMQEKFAEVIALRQQQIIALERQWPAGDWRVGAGHVGLARFHMRRDELAAAVAPFAAGVASYVQTLGPDHPWTAAARAQWGLALIGSGRAASGNRELDRARASILTLPNGPNTELQGIIGQLVTGLRAGNHTLQAERFVALLPPD
jgi:tetratricopeptide (TPR) repeat protein